MTIMMGMIVLAFAKAPTAASPTKCAADLLQASESIEKGVLKVVAAIQDCRYDVAKCVNDVSTAVADLALASGNVSLAVGDCGGHGSKCATDIIGLAQHLADATAGASKAVDDCRNKSVAFCVADVAKTITSLGEATGSIAECIRDCSSGSSETYKAHHSVLPEVARICIANQAGFVLHWELQDILTQKLSADSGYYPIDQTRCMSLTDIPGVVDGDVIMCHVHAVLGESQFCTSAVRLSNATSVAATFTCSGTTLGFACSLNQIV